jgi:hypothetical protein
MTDDVYLGMQAQNIAIIDMTMLRPLEEMALDEFFSDADHVSGADAVEAVRSESNVGLCAL